jgi:hypothetical protein
MHILVVIANDRITLTREPRGPLLILVLLTRMGITVQLDDQLAFSTEEVGDVRANCMLPAKLKSVQSSVPETPPDFLLRWRCDLTHLFGEFEELRLDSMGSKCHGPCAKRPSP